MDTANVFREFVNMLSDFKNHKIKSAQAIESLEQHVRKKDDLLFKMYTKLADELQATRSELEEARRDLDAARRESQEQGSLLTQMGYEVSDLKFRSR